jgi:peptide/nickel transport system substrate-binding protein
MVTYIQETWRDIGVAMSPRFVDFSILLENLNGPKDYQVCNLGFSWDANGDQGAMFRTDAYEGGFNRMRYSNPEFDRLDELQRRELDQQKRIDILIEQANIINEDVPIGILIFRDTIIGHNQRLRNFRPNGYATWWSLPYAWIEPQ